MSAFDMPINLHPARYPPDDNTTLDSRDDQYKRSTMSHETQSEKDR